MSTGRSFVSVSHVDGGGLSIENVPNLWAMVELTYDFRVRESANAVTLPDLTLFLQPVSGIGLPAFGRIRFISLNIVQHFYSGNWFLTTKSGSLWLVCTTITKISASVGSALGVPTSLSCTSDSVSVVLCAPLPTVVVPTPHTFFHTSPVSYGTDSILRIKPP